MKLLISGLSIICSGLAMAQTITGSPKPSGARQRLTIEERKARRIARIKAEGGLVTRPVSGKSVRLMTKTDKVSVADLEKIAEQITSLLGFKVECVDGSSQTSQRTGCLIAIVYQENGPTLLVAPEDPWASINVKNLLADNPNATLLKNRVAKEVWRAFGYAMGAANSNMQPCLMRPIYGLKDLDAEKVSILCPEPLSGIAMSANRLNIAYIRSCSYKTACEEGWASAPTNDIQKAIWEEVHTPPEKPLKITFDKDKQKPVVK